jgi:hypothetical protein
LPKERGTQTQLLSLAHALLSDRLRKVVALPIKKLKTAGLIREVYRRELLPERILWWLAAAGMRDWFRVLRKHLEPHLGEKTESILSEHAAHMFLRRKEAVGLSDARSLALLMGALYRRDAKSKWIFEALGGGAASTMREEMRARLLLSRRSVHERWVEVATHLGELLIVMTEELPAKLPHARKILGDICFEAGAKYARRVKDSLGIEGGDDPPTAAMEVLRMSEYVFRVNPEHSQSSDKTAGWLEGSACLWYPRPGWNGAHCGIFGQFQSGIASVYGLRYHLSKTIPKHGGHTCRIDVKPIINIIPASSLHKKESAA